MNDRESTALVKRHIASGRGIILGNAYMFEMTRQTAIEALRGAIERVGGTVLEMSSDVRPTRSDGRRTRTVHTIVAILPDTL